MATIDVRVQAAELLKAYPGHAFCDTCLSEKLHLSVRDVRYARIGLAGSREFEQQTWYCSVCLEVKHVIHVAWLHFESAADDHTRPVDV